MNDLIKIIKKLEEHLVTHGIEETSASDIAVKFAPDINDFGTVRYMEGLEKAGSIIKPLVEIR